MLVYTRVRLINFATLFFGNDLTLTNNHHGVLLVHTSDSWIKNVSALNNSHGIELYSSSYNMLTNNTANSNNDWCIAAGIFLYDSSHNILTNSTANTNNDHGIFLYDSNHNMLTNNTANSNNDHGIYLDDSSYNTLTNNTASNNDYGIYLLSSNSNHITGNIASNNDHGTYLWGPSNNNLIFLNNFINNTGNVHSYKSTNIWNSTEKITYAYNGSTFTNYLGNYWDDYSDVDADNDGIWDHPYNITDGNADYYPLVNGIETTLDKYTFKDYVPNLFDKLLEFLGQDIAIHGRLDAVLEPAETVKDAKVDVRVGYIRTKYISIFANTWDSTTWDPLAVWDPDPLPNSLKKHVEWETKTFDMIKTDSGHSAELKITSSEAGNILVDLYSVLTGGFKTTIISKLLLPGSDVYITGEEPVYIYAEITKIRGTNTAGNQFEHTINKKLTTTYHKQYNAWQAEMLKKQNQYFVVHCPVNVVITDQYGRCLSSDGTRDIPNANMAKIQDMKLFSLPANLTYTTEIDAYDTGTFNFTRVLPIGNNISIIKFENISITASTKAFVEIGPNVTNYTMNIDYDGDGNIDEEKNPDVNETIIIPTLRGDLNHNGILTPTDAAIALKLAATGGWDANADVNRDRRITSLDALMIMQAATGAIEL